MKPSTGALVALLGASLALTLLPRTIDAFPNGAASCALGEDKFPRRDSPHAGQNGGTLADGGLTVLLGTVDLEVGLDVPAGGQQYTPIGTCTGEVDVNTGYELCLNCQGDCDVDSECAPGLVCFFRPNDEQVPGCYGLAATAKDYCYDPGTGTGATGTSTNDGTDSVLDIINGVVPVTAPTTAGMIAPTIDAVSPTFDFGRNDVDAVQFSPIGICNGAFNDVNGYEECEQCQGDCDGDDECSPGLVCFQRDGNMRVPGCYGVASIDRDYCTTPDAIAAPLPADYLPQMAPTTTATNVVAPAPVAAPVVAPTVPAPLPDLRVIGDCDDNNLCPLCTGDCDDDDHCEDGTFCFQRDGNEPVPGCGGNGRDGLDYCVSEDFNRKLKVKGEASVSAGSAGAGLRKAQKSAVTKQDKPAVRRLQGGPLEIQTTRDYTLTLDGMGGAFKGFLFRVSGAEGQDLSNVLITNNQETQIMTSTGEAIGIPGLTPGSCAVGVSGATHTNNNDKQTATVLLNVPAAAVGEINLEVTSMINRDLWYLTTYTIMAVDQAQMQIPEQVAPAPPPTVAVVAPTAAAVAPVAAPVAAPTQSAPVAAPVAAPTAAAAAPTASASVTPETLPSGTFGPAGLCTAPSGLCLLCEGDCDSDADCEGDLVCYQRVATEAVPYCSGDATPQADYCSHSMVVAETSAGSKTALRLAATLIVLVFSLVVA